MAVDIGKSKQGGCPQPPPPRPNRPHPRPERPFSPPPPPPPFFPGPCCPPTNTLVLNNTIIKSIDDALKITEGYVQGRPAYFIEFDHELIKPVIVGEDPIIVKEGVFTEDDGSEKNGYLITIADMTGATDSVDGKAGSVPAPKAGEETKFLRGDGKWATITIPEVEQSDWTEQDSSAQSFIKHKPELATVATTGSYDDLSDKPSIPDAQIQSDWAQNDNTKVDYIKGKPGVFQGATDNSNGVSGFVPAPLTTDKDKFLCGNGSWVDMNTRECTAEEMDRWIEEVDSEDNSNG